MFKFIVLKWIYITCSKSNTLIEMSTNFDYASWHVVMTSFNCNSKIEFNTNTLLPILWTSFISFGILFVFHPFINNMSTKIVKWLICVTTTSSYIHGKCGIGAMTWCGVMSLHNWHFNYNFILFFWNKIFFQRSTLIGINQHHTFSNSINILTHLIVNIHVKVFEINIIWVWCCCTLVMMVKLMEKQFWFSEN